MVDWSYDGLNVERIGRSLMPRQPPTDYDNDGTIWICYFTTVYGGNYARLYRNDGNWNFSNVTDSEGLGGQPSTYQGAWADYDNDGDQDLLTAGTLYRNDTTGNNWLKIELVG